MTALMAWQPHLSISGCKLAFDMMRTGSYTVDTAPTPDAVTALTNQVSSTSWSEATNPPEYQERGLNGKPCMRFDGINDRIMSTEAAVVNVFAGTDTPLTAIIVAEPILLLTIAALIGAGNSGTATNDTYRIGQSNAGTGRWSMNKTDPGGTSASSAGNSTNLVSEPQVGVWNYTGTAISIYRGLTAHVSGAALDVAAMTCNRVAIGIRPDSTPDSPYDGRMSALWLFNSSLSASDQKRVTTRAMSQYGIWS